MSRGLRGCDLGMNLEGGWTSGHARKTAGLPVNIARSYYPTPAARNILNHQQGSCLEDMSKANEEGTLFVPARVRSKPSSACFISTTSTRWNPPYRHWADLRNPLPWHTHVGKHRCAPLVLVFSHVRSLESRPYRTATIL